MIFGPEGPYEAFSSREGEGRGPGPTRAPFASLTAWHWWAASSRSSPAPILHALSSA
jgi:hypothetical protein